MGPGMGIGSAFILKLIIIKYFLFSAVYLLLNYNIYLFICIY